MKTADLLKQLIAIPSFVKGGNGEEEIGNFVKDYFAKRNYFIEEQIVFGKRKNILCGNTKDPEIVLMGHLDTVLPKEQTEKPFQPKIIQGKLYGLGAVDMKAGLAVMLSLAEKIKSTKVAYVFTCDEEYEFKGSLKLTKKYKWKPKLIINLEPTGLQIGNGCRGITEFNFDVYGKSAHASRKYLGINAIEKAVKLTQDLEKQLQKFDDRSVTSLNLSSLSGGTLTAKKNSSVELSGLGMVVPDFARVNCEIRVGNKKTDMKLITSLLRKLSQKEKIIIRKISFKFFFGTFFTPREKLKTLENIVRNTISLTYRDINTAGFYEVQILQNAWECDAVIFGPGPIEKAHCVDEYVEITTIDKAESILEEYLRKVL